MTDPALVAYYERRAAEYERIYERPERRSDLAAVEERVTKALAGRRVLEIAAGTGYWTRRIAREAASVVATDAAAAVLELARRETAVPPAVRYARVDAFRLPFRAGTFDGLLAAFWWSHVPKARLASFLTETRRLLTPDAAAVFVDNRFVEGSSTPIAMRDAAGDTWQERGLADGSRHAVRKNFPSADELRSSLRALHRRVEITESAYFWIAIAET